LFLPGRDADLPFAARFSGRNRVEGIGDEIDEDLLEELAAKEAFGRGAEVWEVANVIVFLASTYSSYMTGEILSVSSQRA